MKNIVHTWPAVVKNPTRRDFWRLFAGLAMWALVGCDDTNTIKPMANVELVWPGMSVAKNILPASIDRRLMTIQAMILWWKSFWSPISIQNIWIIQLDRWDENSYIMRFEWSGKYAGLHFQYTDSGFLTNLWREYLNILKLPGLLSVLESSKY